jgi:hypothetical protein
MLVYVTVSYLHVSNNGTGKQLAWLNSDGIKLHTEINVKKPYNKYEI